MKNSDGSKISGKGQIFLYVILIASVIIAIGIYYYKYESDLLRTKKLEELNAIASIKSEQISNWYSDELFDINSISNRVQLLQNVENLLSREETNLQRSLTGYLSEIAAAHGYYNILIYSPEGDIKFSLLESFEKSGVKLDSSIIKAANSKQIVSTDLYKCEICGKIHIDFIAPLLNENKEIISLFAVRKNPDNFLFPLINRWPTSSKTSETLIVRKEQDSVLFINELRHLPGSSLNLKISLSEKNVPAVQAVSGYSGIWEGIDYRGVEVIAQILPVKNTPWFMIAKVDRDELFEELNYRSLVIIIFILLVIGISAFSLSFVYQYNQRNVYKSLYTKEIALAEKEEEYKTTLYSIGDGVITTDTIGQIKQMNPVAEQLTAWTEADARGESLETVFKIINEETRNSVENPVIKVLREGLIVGLANHTLLISKDGKEIPIADSGAPIKNNDNKIIGVVLVFRDQTEEREAETKLLKSEQRNKALLNAIPDMMFILNKEGVFLDYKAPEKSKFLIPPSLFVNKKLTEVLPEELAELTMKYINKLYDTGEIQNYVYKLDLNGEQRYFDNRLVLADDGTALSIARDITENKLIEEALRESENSLNLAQQQANLGSWELEVGTGEGKWSDQMFRIFDLDPADGIPDIPVYLERIHPEDRELLQLTMKQLFEGIDPEIKEFRTNPEFGPVKYLLPTYSVMRDENGNTINYTGTTLDITNLKLTELALKESEEIFNHFMERSPIYIFFKDKNLRSIRLSKNYEKMLGKPLKELLGKSMDELFPSELAKNMIENDLKIMKEGRLVEVDEEFNGRYYSTIKFPIYIDDKPEYLAGFTIDMTERKKMIEELVKAKNEAEKADRLKFEFLAQMSHEIRTPLNTVLNYTSLIKDEYKLNHSDELAQIFYGIDSASKRVIRTIDLVLNISQLTTDAYEFNAKDVDLYEDIILQVEKELSQTAQLKKLELKIEKTTDDTRLVVDEYSVSQIFINLVENAIKYTKQGSVIIKIFKSETKKLQVDIADTGIGMGDDFMSTMFTPFSQEETGYTRRYEGTGLGLHLVKKYCEMNNAEIFVKSIKNKGSVFSVVFNA